MTSAFDKKLAEFDRHCFPISAHRAFIGSLFIIDAIYWFDARQKQLQSTTRTAPSGNWRQRGWVRTIWLRHGRAPRPYRRERNWVSQPPTPADRASVDGVRI